MDNNFILMHMDIPCGVMAVDEISGSLTHFKSIDPEYTPFLGKADERSMKKWWDARAIPGARAEIGQFLRAAGCENTRIYLAKNLALSLTDTYWVCPADLDLHWDDVSLYRGCGTGIELLPYNNNSSYDPNASLGGQMDKYWELTGDCPVLVKRAYKYHGQQNINELFATIVNDRQDSGVEYVRYSVEKTSDNGVLSRCKAFTNEKLELVTAYEILGSAKLKNDASLFDQYITICEGHGIAGEDMKRFMDYQTLVDFAISNTDEHLMNFGVLRDTSTMKLVSPAPMFDFGNSMFYADEHLKVYSRAELLERKITSFYDSEEKMLKQISNKKMIDIDALPSCDEVMDLYTEYGLPEERALLIAGNYNIKLQLLSDFQKGITISLYNEKKKLR